MLHSIFFYFPILTWSRRDAYSRVIGKGGTNGGSVVFRLLQDLCQPAKDASSFPLQRSDTDPAEANESHAVAPVLDLMTVDLFCLRND